MAFNSEQMNTKHLWGLASGLLDLQKSGRFCDIQLLCSDGIINAHTAVLTSACNTFQATIQHTHMHLPMMEYSSDTVQRMVKYLYTGQIDRPPVDGVLQFESLMRTLGLPVTQPPLSPVQPATTKESMTFSVRNTQNASSSNPPGEDNYSANAKQEIDLELLSLSLNTVQSAMSQKPTGSRLLGDSASNDVANSGDLVPHPAGPVAFPTNPSDSEGEANFEDDVKFVPEIVEGTPSKKRKSEKGEVTGGGLSEAKKRKKEKKRKKKLALAAKRAKEAAAKEGKEEDENEAENKEDGDEGNEFDDIVLPPRRKKYNMCDLCGKNMGKERSQTLQHMYIQHKVPFQEEDIAKGYVVKCTWEGCPFITAKKKKVPTATLR